MGLSLSKYDPPNSKGRTKGHTHLNRHDTTQTQVERGGCVFVEVQDSRTHLKGGNYHYYMGCR